MIRLRWRRWWLAPVEASVHRQLAAAVARGAHLLRHGLIDLLGGGWVLIEWETHRLRADRFGARYLSPWPYGG